MSGNVPTEPTNDLAAFLVRELWGDHWRRAGERYPTTFYHDALGYMRFDPERNANDAFALVPRLREWAKQHGAEVWDVEIGSLPSGAWYVMFNKRWDMRGSDAEIAAALARAVAACVRAVQGEER